MSQYNPNSFFMHHIQYLCRSTDFSNYFNNLFSKNKISATNLQIINGTNYFNLTMSFKSCINIFKGYYSTVTQIESLMNDYLEMSYALSFMYWF